MRGASTFWKTAVLSLGASLMMSGALAMPAPDAVLGRHWTPDYYGSTSVPYPVTRPASLYTRVPVRPKTPRVTDLGVFASVAIKAGSLPIASNWQKISGSDFTGLFTGDCDTGTRACDTATGKRLQAIAAKAAGMTAVDALQYVNARVNSAITYRDDSVGWGKSDYWANPLEIASKGFGDCEDYAIAKMWLLRSIGYDESQLQLVLLKNKRSGIQHAVLAVHVNGERYVLDNMTQNIGKDSLFVAYSPIVSFVGDNNFIHGFSSKTPNLAKASEVNTITPASE